MSATADTTLAFCPCCHRNQAGVFVRSDITHELICRDCNQALDAAEAIYLARL